MKLMKTKNISFYVAMCLHGPDIVFIHIHTTHELSGLSVRIS